MIKTRPQPSFSSLLNQELKIVYFRVIKQRNVITSAHVIPVRLRTKTLSAENVPAGDAAPGGNRSLFSLQREGAGATVRLVPPFNAVITRGAAHLS